MGRSTRLRFWHPSVQSGPGWRAWDRMRFDHLKRREFITLVGRAVRRISSGQGSVAGIGERVCGVPTRCLGGALITQLPECSISMADSTTLRDCTPSTRDVRPSRVVVAPPALDDDLGLAESVEDFAVEQLIAQASVGALMYKLRRTL
jgi:hypothetical protein